MEGIRFSLDGQIFVSDGQGIAQIQVGDFGWHRLEAIGSWSTDRGIRAVFSRWCCGMGEGPSRSPVLRMLVDPSRFARLEAGYKLSYLVSPIFVDLAGNRVDPQQIDSLAMRSSIGGLIVLSEFNPAWLLGGHGVRQPQQLLYKEVQYSVESVVVHGSNVPLGGEQRFYPSRTREWEIELFLYSARISARDALFGFPMGTAILLEHPDGKVERHAIGPDADLTLYALSPGFYQVNVDGAQGISPTVAFEVSRNQALVLRVVSYLDFAVVFLVLDSVVLGFLLRARPQLFSALRSRTRSLPDPPPMNVGKVSRAVAQSETGVIDVSYGALPERAPHPSAFSVRGQGPADVAGTDASPTDE